MAATENLKLGKLVRVEIGKTSTASTDADFQRIINENEVTMSYGADDQQISTKENGKVSTPGDETYEFKFTVNLALADPSLRYLAAAKNKSWPYRITSDDNVWYSGRFILTGVENKAGSVGVVEGSYTLKNSGPVTENDPETGAPYTAVE